MKRVKFLKHCLCGCAMLCSLNAALAADRVLVWSDPAGDGSSVGDVVSARLAFDSGSGEWAATWEASNANPFTGNARFNLNLFDTALGDPNAAAAPQVSLDRFKDFGTSTATSYTYTGTSSFLKQWRLGDLITSGNGASFQSGVVNMNAPYGRDKLLATGTITTQVPEAETYAMMLAGLGLLGLVVRRRKQKTPG